VVLRRRLGVSFAVHRGRARGGFDERPDADLPVDFPVDYSAGAELDGPFPSLDGDFDGDGHPDFAAPKGEGAIGVWLSGGKQLLSEYPRAIVHVPLTRYWKVVDLDGDKRADALLYYRFHAEREGEIAVLRNTGRGW
jgi:hypothetical protein